MKQKDGNFRGVLAFPLFEALIERKIPGEIRIDDFVSQIGFSGELAKNICDYWKRTRGEVKIFFFPFACPQPILGAYIGDENLAINSRPPIPKEMRLFILFHESQHIQQHQEGRLEEQYFQTVVNDDKESFIQNYQLLEDEANTFAFNSMRAVGLSDFSESQERSVRSNERAGDGVFKMIKGDILRTKANSLAELIRIQILPPVRP